MNLIGRTKAGVVSSCTIALSLVAESWAQDRPVAPQWALADGYVLSQTGERLSEVLQACANPEARYATTFEERTLVDAYQDRNEFGNTIVVFRMASWTDDSTVVVRFIVNAAAAAIRGEAGVLTIIGQPRALEGYNWMFTDGDEPSFAGPTPDTPPFEVPCANAERAAELLNDTLPFLPSGPGPLDIVEASYRGYLRSITTRSPDDRLDPIIAACRAPADAARPANELISAGYDDDITSETSGRIYVTLVSHDDQSKELTTYFLDPAVTYARSPDEKSLILVGGEAGASGHSGWISPSGNYSHVGSFEVSDGYGDTASFHCEEPYVASSAVYGLREWLSAGLPRAPEISYSLRFDREANEDAADCLFSDADAVRTAEMALYAQGLHPQRTEPSNADAQLQFVLTPRYADMMLPDQCHYAVDAEARWELGDPGALIVNLGADPIETSFRDLDMIASRAGRDFLRLAQAQYEAPEPASLP
ncbi:MAG: hypothetical protein AAFR65_12105 [Pseudomonadota bacterium]